MQLIFCFAIADHQARVEDGRHVRAYQTQQPVQN